MLTQFLFATMTIAGIAILWRNWLNDHPNWKHQLLRLPWNLGKTLLCGSCFTYWLSCIYIILFNPLQDFIPNSRFSLPAHTFSTLHFIISWMSLSWTSLVARFGYVLLQETVAYTVHHWRGNGDHHH